MPRKSAKLQLIEDVAEVIRKMSPNKPELAEFWVLWIKHNKNATKAYAEMRPHVTHGSAEVMGCLYLAEIGRNMPDVVLASYGLDLAVYMKQLKEGVEADKWNDFTGEREPDHKTRKLYHDKLGQALGFEGKDTGPSVQVNVMNVLSEDVGDYGE